MQIAHITASESPVIAAAALCAWDAHAVGHRAPFRGSVPLDHGKALDFELGREASLTEETEFEAEFHRALAARGGASEDATHWDGERWREPSVSPGEP